MPKVSATHKINVQNPFDFFADKVFCMFLVCVQTDLLFISR